MLNKAFKIAFFLPTNFNIITPFLRPLGGSQSAVIYLALELVKLGHNVSLITSTQKEFKAMGVQCYPMSFDGKEVLLPPEVLSTDFDIYIVKNGIPQLGNLLKSRASKNAQFYFWTGHAHNQPAVRALVEKDVGSAYRKIICLSDWQKQQYVQKFDLAHDNIKIIRHAISPSFENLFADKAEMVAQKSKTPEIAYTSTPFRGLDILLDSFNKVRTLVKDVRLTVYSSMQIYGVNEESDQYKDLYTRAAEIPDVDYLGALTQIELAGSLRSKQILAYPNTFAETSCIAVMEAMAAGLKIITSDLGALPETTLGLGELLSQKELLSAEKGGFSSTVEEYCGIINTTNFTDLVYKQVQIMNEQNTWRVRARQWVEMFNEQS